MKGEVRGLQEGQEEITEEQQIMSRHPGAVGPVNEETVEKALSTYKEYKDGIQALRNRVVRAEEWWRLNHWNQMERGASSKSDQKPTSAWLFNSIINKHADFMDNYPIPAILPREKSDEQTAKVLSEVVPVIMEQNGMAKTYSECCWDKPKIGTAVYGVFWNKQKENGLGDIEISHTDLLNIVWQPGIGDIQESRNVFVTRIVDRDLLIEEYEFLKDRIKGGAAERPEYIYESNIKTDDQVTVYDWYYKRRIRGENGTGKTILHYCKFVEGAVLYATENDVRLVGRGWYDHGKYPFVLDTMFPEKGSPAGFGYLDVMINPQEYIDRLDGVILKAAMLNKPRFMVSNGVNVNVEELTDLSRDIVTVNGTVDESRVKQIKPPEISDVVISQRDAKVNELKETSGNRDFSQGSTASGVTAASAIAALQEAGSKLSRDMIKNTYTAYEEIVTLVVELIRQFYDLPRCFRITGESGEMEYRELTNEGMKNERIPMMSGGGVNITERRPVFDIKISAQKASPYSRIANNELAKELFGMGIFNPQLADQAKAVVTMMDFDRKEEVLKIIHENGTMYETIQHMQGVMVQMAELIAKTTGDTSVLQAVGAAGMGADLAMADTDPRAGKGEQVKADNLGGAANQDNSQAGKARKQAAAATEVK